MLKAGFVPNDAFNVVGWLGTFSLENVDRAVELLGALLTNPRVDRWAYTTQNAAIRMVLTEGVANGSDDTIARVHEIVSFLSSVGETSYLDVTRSWIEPRGAPGK